MAITVGTRFFNNDGTITSHTFSVTIPADAKVIAFIATESATAAISSVQFNGSAMTLVDSQSFSPGTGEVQIAAYYIDTSLGAGSYNLTYTTSPAIVTTLTVYPLNGAAAGAPEASYFDTQSSTGSIVGDNGSLTVSAGAYLMSVAINSAVVPTVTVSASVTLGDNSTASGARVSNAADIQATGGSKTTQWTYSSTSTTKMMMAVSVAEATSSTLTAFPWIYA